MEEATEFSGFHSLFSPYGVISFLRPLKRLVKAVHRREPGSYGVCGGRSGAWKGSFSASFSHADYVSTNAPVH